MLRGLVIDNFQSHKHSEVEFSEDVTAIVGLNNHGKSAIFRSLQKAIRNVPDGNSFITDTPKQESVCLITVYSDDGIVTRKVCNDNASDANSYIVKNGDVDDVYAKFGRTGIPEEVLQHLPTDIPIIFGDVEIDLNFQNQIDPLFLMQGTGLPALRGKVLGRSTGVDNVQRAIQIGASEEKKLKSEIKYLQEQQTILNSKLLKYNKLDDQINTLTVCNNLLEGIEQKKKLLDSYETIAASLRDIVSKATILKVAISKMKVPSQEEIQSIRDTYTKLLLVITIRDTIHIQQFVKHQLSLLAVLSQIQEYFQYINNKAVLLIHIQNLLQVWSSLYITKEISTRLNLSLGGIQESFKMLVEHYANMETLAGHQERLDIDAFRLGNFHTAIEEANKDILKVSSELDAFKKEIKVCPTCGRAW